MTQTEMARVRRTAELLVALRRGGPPAAARPATLPPDLAPQDEAQAYAVQAAVGTLLGAPIGGWKLSPHSASSALAAPVFAAEVHHSPARLGTRISRLNGGIERLGVEPEIAFTLRADLPARAVPYTRTELIEAIDAAHAAFEIIVSRFASHEGAAPLDRLADAISNAGLIIGPPCRDWRQLDLTALPLTFELESEGARRVQHVRGGHPIGDPLAPALWMANHFGRAAGAAFGSRGLRAGDLITTGSCAGLHYLTPGGIAHAHFEGLGDVGLRWG